MFLDIPEDVQEYPEWCNLVYWSYNKFDFIKFIIFRQL